MYCCPHCPTERLIRTPSAEGIFFECPLCRGRAMGLSVLRHAVEATAVQQLWKSVVRGESASGVDCPVCRQSMAEVGIPNGEPLVHLDVCRRCQFLWLDPRELERLPPRSEEPAEPPRSEEFRRLQAQSEIRAAEARHHADAFGEEPPEEVWKWVPALLGMPVEHGVQPLRARPWATWIVAALLVLVYFCTRSDSEVSVVPFAGHHNWWIAHFGFIPGEALRLGGLTLLTSFFLHAGIWHLVGNTYFLLIFGDNVEDHLGRIRYIGLLVVATVVGNITHGLFDPRLDVPCVGASGGISGVIVFYALQFPHARLGILWRYWMLFRWARFPAWAALGFWILMQCLAAPLQLLGISHVSAIAHLGGAATGLVAWLLYQRGWLRFPAALPREDSTWEEISNTFQRIRDA